MAILCTTCGTELDLPPGPPPRQVRCPICRAVMDTALARRVEPDPLPAAEPFPPPRPYRTAAPSAFPLGLVLLVGGGLVTLGTGLLFMLFIAVAVEANRGARRPAAAPPVMVRPAEVLPVGVNPNLPPPVFVAPGGPFPPNPAAPRARPPQFPPLRPVAPPPVPRAVAPWR